MCKIEYSNNAMDVKDKNNNIIELISTIHHFLFN